MRKIKNDKHNNNTFMFLKCTQNFRNVATIIKASKIIDNYFI